jgi:hypothetical protein
MFLTAHCTGLKITLKVGFVLLLPIYHRAEEFLKISAPPVGSAKMNLFVGASTYP